MQPLVSAAWLNSHRSEPNLVVLDIRSAIDGSTPESFAQGHIPGAVHSDYDKAGWRVTRNNVPFMVPTTAELEKLIGDLGIDETSHVVVVPAGVNVIDFGSAARTYWTLKYAGVGNVSILDGGLAAWKAAGYALETGAHAPSPAIFTATIDNSILALAPDVEKIEQNGGATLVDARPVSFFLGKEKAPASAAYGHIPGALNIDSAQFYDSAANRLKPKAELTTIAGEVPAGAAVSLLQHRPLGGDRLVRAARIARPQEREALCRLDGGVDQQCQPPHRVRAHQVGRSEEEARPRHLNRRAIAELPCPRQR